MNFSQFIAIIRARWKIVALIFCVTVVTAGVITKLLPKTYTATASLVIDLKNDPIMGQSFPGILIASFLATQVDIIKSDKVARRAMETLGLTNDPTLKAKYDEAAGNKGDFETWLATAIRKNTEVVPARESSVITVSYKTNNAQQAALVANALVQSYTDVSRDLRVDPARRSSSFFDQQAKQAREKLEQAQTKLSAYQKANGILATDERLDVESARLNDLSAQIVQLQGMTAEANSRAGQAYSAGGDTIADVQNNPVVAGLRSDLSRNEARLKELSARLGDMHPQVIELKASIGELRSRLNAETARVVSGVGVANRIAQSRLAEVRSLYEQQRQKVMRMRDGKDQGAVYQREVESAQRQYDTILARQNQTTLESRDTLTNVAVLSQATTPLIPSSPKSMLNMIAAAVFGTLLGVGAAVLLEFSNRKVRSIDDVVQSLGLPVLGVLPGPGRAGHAQPQSLLARQVLGQLPAPSPKRA